MLTLCDNSKLTGRWYGKWYLADPFNCIVRWSKDNYIKQAANADPQKESGNDPKNRITINLSITVLALPWVTYNDVIKACWSYHHEYYQGTWSSVIKNGVCLMGEGDVEKAVKATQSKMQLWEQWSSEIFSCIKRKNNIFHNLSGHWV